MKKPLIVLAILFAALIFFYGVVSSLVNKGYGLGQALMIFALVAAGSGLLVWFFGKDTKDNLKP